MENLRKKLQGTNGRIELINQRLGGYLKDSPLIPTRQQVEVDFGPLEIPYELVPKDAIIDVFISYSAINVEKDIILLSDITIYSLGFPYSGARGTRAEIEEIYTKYLGKTSTVLMCPILGNQAIDIIAGSFKSTSILKANVGFDGTGTIIGIIDTGIDYTNPVFIDENGETRIISIWDQTIGSDSPYGYGTVYDREIINTALKSSDPLSVVPHTDEWGHGTILAGIAGADGEYREGTYKGVAPGAEFAIVKLRPASAEMQRPFHGNYNPLGFSSLDIALAFQFLSILGGQIKKPISICLPMGTNTGPHDGSDILDSIISGYSANPGVCSVLSVGGEANKSHHASGDLKEQMEQEVRLTIPKGQVGFLTEVWAMFGDRIEVFLTPPRLPDNITHRISLNETQTYKLSEGRIVWSQGIKFDVDTGSQVIRFYTENPIEGEWIITVRGVTIIDGHYHIWIPKTGMILPDTVLSPSDPFTTIYNTSSTGGVVAIGCYDRSSLTACSGSGRGFTRIGKVSPDYVAEGIRIQGPLPDNKWGTISGTAPSGAITVGVTSLIYEDQIAKGNQLPNTVIIKALLTETVKRQPTVSYPNPTTGYGVIDINSELV